MYSKVYIYIQIQTVDRQIYRQSLKPTYTKRQTDRRIDRQINRGQKSTAIYSYTDYKQINRYKDRLKYRQRQIDRHSMGRKVQL